MNNWSDIKQLRFMSLVHSNRGHVKSEISMKDKWTSIMNIFTGNYADMLFKSYTGLQTQFDRIHEKEMLIVGVKKPGHNLSGLPEVPTEFQKKCILIQEEVEEEENVQIRETMKKEKKRKYQSGMLTHELLELSQQGMPTDVSNQNKRLTTNSVSTYQCDTFTSTSTYGNHFSQISPQVRAPIDLVDEMWMFLPMTYQQTATLIRKDPINILHSWIDFN